MNKLTTYILFLLLILTTPIFSQGYKYGKGNGNQWNSFNEQTKNDYMLGIFDGVSFFQTTMYDKIVTQKGKILYYLSTDYNDRITRTSPAQMVEALNQFYSDYHNTNVLICDALDIAHMEITGASHTDIDWWTRYYRADEYTRSKMMDEKPLKSFVPIPPPPIFDDSTNKK